MAAFGVSEQAVNTGVTPAPATAPTPAPAPVKTNITKGGSTMGTTNTKEKMAALKKEGRLDRNLMTAEEKAAEGSKSGNIAFVACLSNEQYKSQVDNTPKPVGYKLKNVGSEAIQVTKMPLNTHPQERSKRAKNPYDVNTEAREAVTVQPGETFVVNLVEMAGLISRLEYGGVFSGEGKTVQLTAQLVKDEELPRAVLAYADASKHIKNEYEPVTEKKGSRWVCKEEYKKDFGNLFIEPLRADGQAGPQKGENARNTAAVFRKLLGNA